MATKNKPEKKVVTIALTEPYRISVKFAPETIVPACAIDSRWLSLRPVTEADWELFQNATFVTNDMKRVRLEFVYSFCNKDGEYEDFLERTCQRLYNMPFCQINAIWRSRFLRLDDYWHVVRLIEHGN